MAAVKSSPKMDECTVTKPAYKVMSQINCSSSVVAKEAFCQQTISKTSLNIRLQLGIHIYF